MTATLWSSLDNPAVTAVLNEVEEYLAGTPHGEHHRRGARVRYQQVFRTFVLNAPGYPVTTLVARNISAHGVGFVSIRPFVRGERFILAFSIGGQSKLLLCSVRFCRKLRGPYFCVGAEFQKCLAAPHGEEQIPLSWLGHSVSRRGFQPLPDHLPAAPAAVTSAPAAVSP